MQGTTLSGKRAIRGRATAALAALGLLVGLGAALGGTAASATGRSAAAAAQCRPAGLVVWLNTQGNGAAGSTFFKLKFTNLSKHACTLRGFPGVSAVSLRGKQLGRSASRDHAHKVHTVKLARGATGTAVLRIVQVGNFSKASCKPRTAAGLRVFPPNGATAKRVPFPFRACSRSGPTFLSVQTVRK